MKEEKQPSLAGIFGVTHTIRDVKRFSEIVRVLVQHGFADVVHELKLDRLLEKGMTLIGLDVKAALADKPRATRIRLAMEELGSTFIKLGQILSTRPDLVPTAWTEEFKLLQDNCLPIPFQEIQTRLNAEFSSKVSKIFRSVDAHPLATASIAQVHRAVLKSGKKVLLKILRPGIEELIASDVSILQNLAEFTEEHFSNLGYSPLAVVREFSREINREIDLTHEGRALDRFRSMFAKDRRIVFPSVFWKASRKGVLAMEEVKGTPLSRLKKRDLSPQDRRSLVRNGARAVLHQCLEAGFFHADPHPGNLIALPHGHLAFIDCGMVGQLDSETMQQLAQLVAGVVNGETEKVIEAAAFLTDAPAEKVEERAFQTDVREIVSQFEHTSLRNLDMGVLLHMLFERLREHKLQWPGDLMLLIKAFTTIQAVGKDLDPDFDMIKFAEPFVQRLLERRYGLPAIKQRIAASVAAYSNLAEVLPGELVRLLKQFRRNKVSLNLEHRGINRLTRTIEHASRNISFALLVAALLVSSSILVLAEHLPGDGNDSLGFIGVTIAIVLIVVRAIKNYHFKS